MAACCPEKSDFFYVQCKDISAGGVSFYLKQPPDYRNIVIALGHAPQLSYFTARVIRVMEETRGLGSVCVVGCQFTGHSAGYRPVFAARSAAEDVACSRVPQVNSP